MSKSSRHLRLTLQDVRIGKIGRNRRMNPCNEEFDAYLTALQDLGEAGKVPPIVTKTLADCMDRHKSQIKPPSFAVNYHLAKFIDRSKRPKK